MARARSGWGVLAALCVLSGCMTQPDKATLVQQPKTPAVRTLSSFSDALRCMDDLLWSSGKRDIYLTANGLPDATGRVAGGTKDMLITAISRMSERSNAFRFVDFEPALDDVNALYWMIGVQPQFRAPSYYIRGAITQLDENVASDAVSAGLSLPKFDLGVSADQVLSVVTVDLNVGELVTRQIIPGMSASNSLAVIAAGRGADAGALIGKAGLSFKVSFNQAEGLHQAVRTLVELSTIEVLGKLTRVPYWQCLGIDATNPAFAGEARGGFDAMAPAERVRFVQSVLAQGRYYDGPVNGDYDERTKGAIARWQADHDLIANGRVDFDLYRRMIGEPAGSGAGRRPADDRVASAPDAGGAGLPRPTPTPPGSSPDLTLTSDRGPAPRYRVGEALVARVQPSEDGFVYCYYRDSAGTVARVFPNRFQPDAFIEANRMVEIPPGTQKPFNIRMDRPGQDERIACVVARQEIGTRLPDGFKRDDLQPIPGAALPDILNAFGSVAGAASRSREMSITVLPASVAAGG